MTRFGMVNPGDCAPSDHAGIITQYQWASATDVTAPVVQIATPADGALVSGNVTVAVSATDDTAVAGVGVIVDGAALAVDTTAPYEIAWNTSSASNGSHTIQAWADDLAGNRGTSPSVTVSVQNTAPNTPPTSSFTVTCHDLTCAFTDRSTDPDGGIAGWTWDFGDGTTASEQNPSHSYAAAGSYTVGLTVRDTDGATGVSTVVVTVQNPPPNSAPVASFTTACTNLACSFRDASTDADGTVVAWTWSFGDGTSSTVQNPSHSYSVAGTYTVSLRVTDNLGAASTASRSVTVTAPAPAFDFSLAASPSSKRINAGASTAYSISTSVISGTATGISLSVTGLPSGVTATFNPAIVQGSGSAKLNVTTTSSVAAGDYALTIAASGGGVTHTTDVNLTIVRKR
jgi:PKD repeat protein